MIAVRLPEWLTPPEEGYTAEDLDRIPDLPPHTELIDGSLVFVSPQSMFHMAVIDGLRDELRRQAPDGLVVMREMTITLAPRQRPEPDLSVVTEAAFRGLEQTDLPVAEAILVVEVVSQESEIRDRERKPQLYAAAGIPDFWRIENEAGEPVVHAHELASDGTYHLVAVHRGLLKTSRPFPLEIDLTGLTVL
ncbi:Uma2 family endonuclease [Catenulispora subtropica]|uniref:Uma2 family endonuclease n=1 Tax=Catenulispora subtropica TaxID=450798 RepID=A0ABP5E050_9ACTN